MSDGAKQDGNAGAVGGEPSRTHRCRTRETKKVGVEPVRGLRASSLNDVDVNQAARSLASWRCHLAPTDISEAGQRQPPIRPAQQQPKPVPAPDSSELPMKSIMSVLKRVSDIEVTVDYVDTPLSDFIERIKSCGERCPPEAPDEESESDHSDSSYASALDDSPTAAPRQ